jgi:hypothetical protein
MKQDFGATTKVKTKNTEAICEAFRLTNREMGLIAAGSLEPSVFWGMDNQLVIPIVIDTGASISVTGVKSDFVGTLHKVDPGASLQGLNNEVKVHAVGTVCWTIRDQHDRIGIVQTSAYYVPDAQVRLFSPQTSLIECNQGKLVVTKNEATLEVNDGLLLSFPINDLNNLPFALMDDKQRQSMLQFNDMHKDHILLNVAAETNQNISGPQQELLFWHWIMGHGGFQWIQRLMKPKRPRYKKHLDDANVARAVIMTNHASAQTCRPPLCAACSLARGKRETIGTPC